MAHPILQVMKAFSDQTSTLKKLATRVTNAEYSLAISQEELAMYPEHQWPTRASTHLSRRVEYLIGISGAPRKRFYHIVNIAVSFSCSTPFIT
jgi:hypothetical protein